YERAGADPRAVHELNLAYDDIGNVLESASVAYPRIAPDATVPQPVQDEQARLLITCKQHDFTLDRVDDVFYQLRQPSETRTYELSGVTPQGGYFTPADLQSALDDAAPIGYEAPAPASPARRLLHRERTLYWNDDATAPVPLGTMGRQGIRCESYRLCFTTPLLGDLYGDRWTPAMLADGHYVISDDFKASGLFPQTDAAGDAWSRSGFAGLFASPAQHFYLPITFQDAHGSVTAAAYYSDYHLVIES